jgi:hypothetical protein
MRKGGTLRTLFENLAEVHLDAREGLSLRLVDTAKEKDVSKKGRCPREGHDLPHRPGAEGQGEIRESVSCTSHYPEKVRDAQDDRILQ